MPGKRVDYHKYMGSREWALKRNEVHKRANGVCERCHNADIKNVHHISYKRLGDEDVDQDLLGLCRPCHEYLSAKRDDDPAAFEVLESIEQHGLEPALRDKGNWEMLMFWSTGPTESGAWFHGDLRTHKEVVPFWNNYMDAATVVVQISDGVWFHCNSY